MTNCPRCGAPYEGTKFCTKCGLNLQDIIAKEEEEARQAAEAARAAEIAQREAETAAEQARKEQELMAQQREREQQMRLAHAPKQCTECGTINQNSALYCCSCGAPLDTYSVPVVEQAPASPTANPSDDTATPYIQVVQKKSSGALVFVFMMIYFVRCFAIVAISAADVLSSMEMFYLDWGSAFFLTTMMILPIIAIKNGVMKGIAIFFYVVYWIIFILQFIKVYQYYY